MDKTKATLFTPHLLSERFPQEHAPCLDKNGATLGAQTHVMGVREFDAVHWLRGVSKMR
jgi:hypothetical protein